MSASNFSGNAASAEEQCLLQCEQDNRQFGENDFSSIKADDQFASLIRWVGWVAKKDIVVLANAQFKLTQAKSVSENPITKSMLSAANAVLMFLTSKPLTPSIKSAIETLFNEVRKEEKEHLFIVPILKKLALKLEMDSFNDVKEEKHPQPKPKAPPTEVVKTKIIRDVWEENRDVIVKDTLVFFKGKQLCLNQNALAMFYRTGRFKLISDDDKKEEAQFTQKILERLPNDSLALCVKGLIYLFHQPLEIKKYYKEDKETPERQYPQKGFVLLTEAANKGNAAAQFILGVLNERGYQAYNGHAFIENPDPVAAFKWYYSASRNGVTYADRASKILYLKHREAIVKIKNIQLISHLTNIQLNADEQKVWQASPFYSAYKNFGEVIKTIPVDLIPGDPASRRNILVMRRPNGSITFLTEGLSRLPNFDLYPREMVMQFEAFEIGESIETSWGYEKFIELTQYVAQHPELLVIVEHEKFNKGIRLPDQLYSLLEAWLNNLNFPSTIQCSDNQAKEVYLIAGRCVWDSVDQLDLNKCLNLYWLFKDYRGIHNTQLKFDREMIEWFSNQLFQQIGFYCEQMLNDFSNDPGRGVGLSPFDLLHQLQVWHNGRKIKDSPNEIDEIKGEVNERVNAAKKLNLATVDFSTETITQQFFIRSKNVFDTLKVLNTAINMFADVPNQIIGLIGAYLFSLDNYEPVLDDSEIQKKNASKAVDEKADSKANDEKAVTRVVPQPTLNILQRIHAARTMFPFKNNMSEMKQETQHVICHGLSDLTLFKNGDAARNDPEAQNYIAYQLCLLAHKRASVNKEMILEAIQWLRKAAINGHLIATTILGLMFCTMGVGELGEICLMAATKRGSVEAKYYLELYYYSARDRNVFLQKLNTLPDGVSANALTEEAFLAWPIYPLERDFKLVISELSVTSVRATIQARTVCNDECYSVLGNILKHWTALEQRHYLQLVTELDAVTELDEAAKPINKPGL